MKKIKLSKMSEKEFESYANDCANRIECSEPSCKEPFHCDRDESECGDCEKSKCPMLRWLPK